MAAAHSASQLTTSNPMLTSAIAEHQVDVVRALLDGGFDVNQPDDGVTPLGVATVEARIRIFDWS